MFRKKTDSNIQNENDLIALEKDREEFDAAKDAINTIQNKVRLGEIEPATADNKISKINKAVNIQVNCLDWFKKTDPEQRNDKDCLDSYLNIFNTLKKINSDKPSNFDRQAQSALTYVHDLETSGELGSITRAKQTIHDLKDKAAAGHMNAPDMWQQTKEIKDKINKHRLCLTWAASAQSYEEESNRKRDCYYDLNSTYSNLQDTLNKFRR